LGGRQLTKDPTDALDHGVLNEPLAIQPSPQRECHIDGINHDIELSVIHVFLGEVWEMLFFLLFPVSVNEWMVTNVVANGGSLGPASRFVSVNRWAANNINIFKRYPRVFPLGDNGRFKDYFGAGFGSQIIAQRAGDVLWIGGGESRVNWAGNEATNLVNSGCLRLQTRQKRMSFCVEPKCLYSPAEGPGLTSPPGSISFGSSRTRSRTLRYHPR